MRKIKVILGTVLLSSVFLSAANFVFAVNLPFQEQLESAGLQISSEPLLLNLPQVYILPDSPLYFLKKIWEGAQILLASEPEERGEVLLKLAEKRLAEGIALIKKGEWQEAVETLQKYQGQFENGQSMLVLVRDLQKYDTLRNLISRQLQNQALLAAFLEKIGAGEALGTLKPKTQVGELELRQIE